MRQCENIMHQFPELSYFIGLKVERVNRMKLKLYKWSGIL